MATFNVTLHGVEDPFEFAIRQHPRRTSPVSPTSGASRSSIDDGGSSAARAAGGTTTTSTASTSADLLATADSARRRSSTGDAAWSDLLRSTDSTTSNNSACSSSSGGEKRGSSRFDSKAASQSGSASASRTSGLSSTTGTNSIVRSARHTSDQSAGSSSSRSTPHSALINAPKRKRPKSTRSAAIRASDVTVTEGLVLPPIPGAMPPVSTQVRGNTAAAPKSLHAKPVHNGSREKMMELRMKHRYNKQGPNELLSSQLTTGQDYGRWMRTCMPQDEEWVLETRRGIAASEITKFVNEMALTNKDFSLF